MQSQRGVPGRIVGVVNPVRVPDADDGKHVIAEVVRAAGWDVPSWVDTTEDDPGVGQARQAASDGADVVITYGGDGTVRACIEGVAGTRTALAVVPAGTGNLLAANFDLPADPAEVARLVVDGSARTIDVGDVDGQAFAVMAGIGFDAELLDATPTSAKERFGPVAYVGGALAHLRDRPMHAAISLDGQPPVRHRAKTVLVSNVGQLQGGIRVAADASPDDGLLDVVVISAKNLGQWVVVAWGVLTRRPVSGVTNYRCRAVEIRADREHPRQLDGDVIAPGRVLSATIRPGALTLFAPPTSS